MAKGRPASSVSGAGAGAVWLGSGRPRSARPGRGLGSPAVPGLHLASLAIRLPVSGTGPETWRVSNG